jgi:methylene-fatty-acyl-phospholipid synthase
MEQIFNFICENISFDKNVQQVLLYSGFSLIVWGILPHLQHKHKLISSLFSGNKEISADFLAFILIHIGTFRNYAFFEALLSNKRFDYGEYNIISTIFGVIFLCIGSLFWLTSLWKLGLRGSYFGDHFGFILKKKIESFPFNILENPQYNGSKLFLLGQSIIMRSLIGVILTLFISFLYSFVFFVFEKKNMNTIYSSSNNSGDNNEKEKIKN